MSQDRTHHELLLSALQRSAEAVNLATVTEAERAIAERERYKREQQSAQVAATGGAP